MRKARRGQSFSFDAITATALFVVILIIAVIYYYNISQDGIQRTLVQEANIASQNLLSIDGPEHGIIGEGMLDDKKLAKYIERLMNAHTDNERRDAYNAMKLELGIRDDFCIYLEDQEGNLIILMVDDGSGTLVQAPAIFGSERARYIGETDTIECILPTLP